MATVLLVPLFLAGLAVLMHRIAVVRARRRRYRRMTLPRGPFPARSAPNGWNGEVPLWIWYRANAGKGAPRAAPWRPRPRVRA